jgi:transposase
VVTVPTEEQEEKRALIRYHRQIMADRGRCEARGKGLLCAQGIEVHGRWWHGDAWLEVQSDPRLKDWMKEQLIGWRNKILSTDEEQGALRERIAALAPAILPKGVGAYSAAVLHYEMRGFERFTNRRQVGSMTGLCPGIHQSDGRGKEGSINRCGIGIVRWTLVEMVWRLMIWQPQYPPVRRCMSRSDSIYGYFIGGFGVPGGRIENLFLSNSALHGTRAFPINSIGLAPRVFSLSPDNRPMSTY